MQLVLELDGKTTLSGVDAEMARRGGWLPVDGMLARSVGDAILEDSAGPLVEGFGGWESRIVRVEMEGPRGAKERLEADDAKLVIGSRGALGRVARVWLSATDRPSESTVVRTKEGVDVSPLKPDWRVWSQGRVTAGWLRGGPAEDELPSGSILMRQPLMDDETLRERLWQWPEGMGERVRIALPPGRVRSVMMEGRVMAWVSDGPGTRVLARVPTKDVARVEAAVEAAGGGVERVERDLDPAAATRRYGPAASRFEELRRLLGRGIPA